MNIFPAIDIHKGKCVRLRQGNFNDEVVYGNDPVAMANNWESKGAKYLHIVDLDGALNGKRMNEEIIRNIVRSISIPIQLGGGIRTLEDIYQCLDMGISRVVIGTSAVLIEGFADRAIEQYEENLAVSIDAVNGWIATHGWTSISNLNAITFAKELECKGLQTIIYTDIEKDGMLSGPNYQQLEQLKQAVGIQIIASGGISSKDHIERLKNLELYGAIIGKALYTGNILLEEI